MVSLAVNAVEKEIVNLPKASYFGDSLYKWEGLWYYPAVINSAKSIRSNFRALDDDVILASSLKTGTTWLKSLCTSITECRTSAGEDSLVKKNPHECILNLESGVFGENPNPDLSRISSPRHFSTHLAYSLLPDSIKKSECKIIYITRNPKDMLVSNWHFFSKIYKEEYRFEETFEAFCEGVYPYGPFYDHVLEYWKESLKMPDKVLFLKYEELKTEPQEQVKKLAFFLGKSLEDDEVKEVLRRSSLERLKNLEVNNDEVRTVSPVVPNGAFFRIGDVGGWKNYFTPEMEKRIDEITNMKVEGCGLCLDP